MPKMRREVWPEWPKADRDIDARWQLRAHAIYDGRARHMPEYRKESMAGDMSVRVQQQYHAVYKIFIPIWGR